MEKERVNFDGPGVTMDTKRKRESKEEKGPGKKKGKKKHHEEKSEGKTGRRNSDYYSEERPKKKEKRSRENSPEGESAQKRPRADPEGPNLLHISSYTFHSMIGGGGFGKVMLASLKDRRSKVAVKILKKKPGSSSNIQTEANILKLTSGNPYLCQGFAAFQTQRHAFLIMEYVSGGSLRDQLESHGPLDMTRVELYSAEIVCGLQFLHDNGIVHRDLKPDNILLDHEGHIKIADFGMAKQNIFGSRTITSQAGTLDYMAPEIFLNKGYNAAVDWWACGVIICEMATGEIPFPDDSDDEDFSDEPNIPSWLSKDLKDLLRKLLERNPDRRLGVYGNIRQHPFFSAIDWEELEWPLEPPPFDLETVSTWLLKYLYLLNRK
ncbi:protein kinase C delta type-like [Xenopus laevis]|uniref:Protein kinase C delta type-like n=1 Tax=Xenopus laevis TaxID=8355 RepID=A0A8J1KTH1_XENLA|nr:protein kinase C delta type-like [Xenopus laevis]